MVVLTLRHGTHGKLHRQRRVLSVQQDGWVLLPIGAECATGWMGAATNRGWHSDDDDDVELNVLGCRVDILGTNCDQCMCMVQCCFTSTETIRLIRTGSPGRPPRLSHSSWTLTDIVIWMMVFSDTVLSYLNSGIQWHCVVTDRQPNIEQNNRYPVLTEDE